MASLAGLCFREGDYAKAEAVYKEALELQRRVLGEERLDTLNSMSNLARVYVSEGQYAKAEPLYTKAVELLRRVNGEDHPDTITSMKDLAALYRYEGRYAEAEPLFLKVVEVRRRLLGSQHAATRDAIAALADLRLAQQRYPEAESFLREALDHLESLNKESSDAWQPYEHRSLLGFSLMAQKKFAEAEPWLLSGYQGLLRRRAMIPQENQSFLEQAGERLVQFYKDWGKPDKVMEWSQKLQVARSGAGAEPH
jgi:tetratricopeptide (TPR) repeat protein